jgi:hypothetical protein
MRSTAILRRTMCHRPSWGLFFAIQILDPEGPRLLHSTASYEMRNIRRLILESGLGQHDSCGLAIYAQPLIDGIGLAKRFVSFPSPDCAAWFRSGRHLMTPFEIDEVETTGISADFAPICVQSDQVWSWKTWPFPFPARTAYRQQRHAPPPHN